MSFSLIVVPFEIFDSTFMLTSVLFHVCFHFLQYVFCVHGKIGFSELLPTIDMVSSYFAFV